MYTNLWVDLPANGTSTGIALYPTTTGLTFVNSFVQQGGISVLVTPSATIGPLNEIQFIGGFWDAASVVGFATGAVIMVPTNNEMDITAVHIAVAGPYGMILNQGMQGISVRGSEIRAGTDGVVISGVLNSRLLNNVVYLTDAGGTGIAFQATTPPSSGITLDGNTIGFEIGGVGYSATGITSPVAAFTGITIRNNTIYGSAVSIQWQGTGTPVQITNNQLSGNDWQITSPATVYTALNQGENDRITTVASTTAQAFPVYADFLLSGTGAPTSVTGLPSGSIRRGSFIATNAAPGIWTAGATIGNTFTPTQNVPVSWFWDGTKLYAK
jgi:hypothetical protein